MDSNEARIGVVRCLGFFSLTSSPRDQGRFVPAYHSTENTKPSQAEGLSRRRRSAFVITDTELKLIAAAAIMGLSSRPKNG